MRRFGIEVTERHVVDCGITYDDGRRAARSLLESGIHCDTIFAFTDIVAIGAMNQLRDMGIKIPEEIAVASFSGTILSEMSYPRLTTVEPPLEKIKPRQPDCFREDRQSRFSMQEGSARSNDQNAPVDRALRLNPLILDSSGYPTARTRDK